MLCGISLVVAVIVFAALAASRIGRPTQDTQLEGMSAEEARELMLIGHQ